MNKADMIYDLSSLWASVEDSKKAFYYRGLSEWKKEKDRLIDTCLDGQDTIKRLLDALEIPY